MTGFEGDDSGPGRSGSWPARVNVYAVPAVSPVTVLLVAGRRPVIARLCGRADVRGELVLASRGRRRDGAVHDTVAESCPAVAVTFVGWPGAGAGSNSTSTQ